MYETMVTDNLVNQFVDEYIQPQLTDTKTFNLGKLYLLFTGYCRKQKIIIHGTLELFTKYIVPHTHNVEYTRITRKNKFIESVIFKKST